MRGCFLVLTRAPVILNMAKVVHTHIKTQDSLVTIDILILKEISSKAFERKQTLKFSI